MFWTLYNTALKEKTYNIVTNPTQKKRIKNATDEQKFIDQLSEFTGLDLKDAAGAVVEIDGFIFTSHVPGKSIRIRKRCNNCGRIMGPSYVNSNSLAVYTKPMFDRMIFLLLRYYWYDAECSDNAVMTRNQCFPDWIIASVANAMAKEKTDYEAMRDKSLAYVKKMLHDTRVWWDDSLRAVITSYNRNVLLRPSRTMDMSAYCSISLSPFDKMDVEIVCKCRNPIAYYTVKSAEEFFNKLYESRDILCERCRLSQEENKTRKKRR